MLSRDHNILWLPESNGYPTPIIRRPAEPLLAADVALRRQYRGVAEQELDLLQLSSRFMTQASAAPAQIVGSKILDLRRDPSVLRTAAFACSSSGKVGDFLLRRVRLRVG